MSNYKELDEALSLVKNLATIEQIQALLRRRKGEEHVRITAKTIDELVDANLRTAIEKRAIEIDWVFDLIRGAEENGNQHIFYYKVNSRAIAEALSFEKLAPRMWGANWKKKLEDDFPAIRLKPDDYKCSDFRQLPKKPRDWVLKIYGQATIERYTGDLKHEGQFFWRKYEREQLRSVLLARWNSPDLLEIRVDRNDSRRRVEEWHNQVWKMLNPHVIRSQFQPWELSDPMKSLITRQVGNERVYSFRDAKVIDRTRVHVTFQTEADSGRSLFASDETRDSLQSFLHAKSDCDGLTVSWMPQSNEIPAKEMRTLLGVRQTEKMRKLAGDRPSNEMVVQAHCSAEDLDYVTGQLRQFNK
jgi:hypothetical protein